MDQRADVRSFQALEALRIALVKFVDTAHRAVESAEGTGASTLQWLEGQHTHWKAEHRKAQDQLERAKEAYRMKVYFKDATGARQSGTEELILMRKAQARLDRCEEGRRAIAQHRPRVRREVDQFRGGVNRLASLLDREVPVTLANLREAILRLEQYANAQSDVISEDRRVEPAMSMARLADETVENVDLPAVETLRHRTPATQLRRKAARLQQVPIVLPDVPPAAREQAERLFEDAAPGRYDLLSISAPADASALYLERVTPTDETDTGWHVGTATPEPTDGPPGAIPFSKVAAVAPHLGELLRLPVGTVILAQRGAVCRIVDSLGRTLWEESHGDQ